MNIGLLAERLTSQVMQVCGVQARYRILWVLGRPWSGKSTLCQEVCRRTGWQYVNFTLETGYLDSLLGQEKTYQPEDLMEQLQVWCTNCPADILVLDEIEPVLALWNHQQQDVFFRLASHATRLPRGVIIATRLRGVQEMSKLAPGKEHLFELKGEENTWAG